MPREIPRNDICASIPRVYTRRACARSHPRRIEPLPRARVTIGMRLFIVISIACCLAHAQQIPARVRVLRPSCTRAIDWSALDEALRVELRSMGSDLAQGDLAPARLSLDLGCDTTERELVAV